MKWILYYGVLRTDRGLGSNLFGTSLPYRKQNIPTINRHKKLSDNKVINTEVAKREGKRIALLRDRQIQEKFLLLTNLEFH